jgi:hypothetical protein
VRRTGCSEEMLPLPMGEGSDLGARRTPRGKMGCESLTIGCSTWRVLSWGVWKMYGCCGTCSCLVGCGSRYSPKGLW